MGERLISDMLTAARAIVSFATKKKAADLGTDNLLRSGIYFQFLIIGEGLSQLVKLDESIAEQITEHWRIIGFRNQIIHGYAKIDDEITWRVIEVKIPVLIEELEVLLKQ